MLDLEAALGEVLSREEPSVPPAETHRRGDRGAGSLRRPRDGRAPRRRVRGPGARRGAARRGERRPRGRAHHLAPGGGGAPRRGGVRADRPRASRGESLRRCADRSPRSASGRGAVRSCPRCSAASSRASAGSSPRTPTRAACSTTSAASPRSPRSSGSSPGRARPRGAALALGAARRPVARRARRRVRRAAPAPAPGGRDHRLPPPRADQVANPAAAAARGPERGRARLGPRVGDGVRAPRWTAPASPGTRPNGSHASSSGCRATSSARAAPRAAPTRRGPRIRRCALHEVKGDGLRLRVAGREYTAVGFAPHQLLVAGPAPLGEGALLEVEVLDRRRPPRSTRGCSPPGRRARGSARSSCRSASPGRRSPISADACRQAAWRRRGPDGRRRRPARASRGGGPRVARARISGGRGTHSGDDPSSRKTRICHEHQRR